MLTKGAVPVITVLGTDGRQAIYKREDIMSCRSAESRSQSTGLTSYWTSIKINVDRPADLKRGSKYRQIKPITRNAVDLKNFTAQGRSAF